MKEKFRWKKYTKHYKDGVLEEVFGTGTAAVISPVGELYWDDKKLDFNDGEIGELSMKLYNTLTAIQLERNRSFGWVVEYREK